ncbi:MAG: segregation/condensation protein A [Streptococcaceae bacterium]|jgi:segregation and condensation protein A|nr:segregation/condensation protein A [Streptococcaceae bacterium]
MENNTIKLELDAFTGPLDLLLHLVSSYKVDIFDVPLVSVIEQYLAFIHAAKSLNLEIAGDYMVMASQLMLIKSRRLLPTVSEDFQEETEQLEQELLQQIEEYQQIKAATDEISDLHASRAQHFSKARTEIEAQEIQLVHNTTAIDLFLAFSQVVRQHFLDNQTTHTVIASETFTVEEKISDVREKLNLHKFCYFSDFFEKNASKEELITTFLAILELVKIDELTFSQTSPFSEIQLERH